MKRKGEITVFLSLAMLCVFALLCVMTEAARTAGSRYYFQTAVNGSLDTLFSEYHRALWKKYRILGVEHGYGEEIEDRLKVYIEKYLSTENWYPIRLTEVKAEDMEELTEDGGDFLTEEILSYMKYGIWDGLAIAPESGERFLKDVKEAAGAGTMNMSYDGQEKEVKKLEQAAEKVADCVRRQEEEAAAISQALASDDPEGFRDHAREFESEEGKMERLVRTYRNQAERYKKKHGEAGESFAKSGEDFQENRKKLFEEQLNAYQEYLKADQVRGGEIVKQKETGRQNQELLEQTEVLVRELEEAAENSGEDEEDEEDEEEELSLEPAYSLWNGFIHTSLNLEKGKGDKEKQGFLEQVQRLAGSGLLGFVVPGDMEISNAELQKRNLLSGQEKSLSLKNRNLMEQVIVGEYCGKFFANALSNEEKQVRYEMEYLLQGKETDRENLEATVEQLFLIRQGLNLIHILSDGEKREEARGLALTITGAVGLAPLCDIMACFVMVVWAMGEAAVDLRTLLSGGKVPLWKSQKDWNLSLEGLLGMGKERRCPDNKENENGFSYVTYLKLLLLMEGQQEKQERIMSLIQMNIRETEPGFQLSHCAWKVKVRGEASGKHVFFALPIVENFVRGEGGYSLRAGAEKSY